MCSIRPECSVRSTWYGSNVRIIAHVLRDCEPRFLVIEFDVKRNIRKICCIFFHTEKRVIMGVLVGMMAGTSCVKLRQKLKRNEAIIVGASASHHLCRRTRPLSRRFIV
ncbi:hypothetical protein EVAR_88484_1 [Eumeta japonica]|uniref:Uncharacterized protein n=1 Tax=Eumeta variegata TaxID=151549 RepID=A0A4C1XUX1_EUMVA|nr:hypothetical protein EVAR_88484_1 [Eumeta japonica]